MTETFNSTYYSSSLEAALSALLPKGSAVYYNGDPRVIESEGYRVVGADDAQCIVYSGGEAESAIARANAVGKKLIAVPTADFCTVLLNFHRTVKRGFAHVVASKVPDAVVLSESAFDDCASAFGSILSLSAAAFDMTFARRMEGKDCDNIYVERILKLCDDLTDALTGIEKNDKERRKVLTAKAFEAMKLVATAGADSVYQSGVSQVYEASRMLFTAEGRTVPERGKGEYLLCATLLDYYLAHLTLQDGLRFPPDNSRRIDRVSECFNCDLSLAAAYVSPIFPPLKMRLSEYRTKEFSAQHRALLKRVIETYRRSNSVFKRLLPDDGFSLSNIFDQSDCALCLALAPDVFSADSFLSFMKQTGSLDRYFA